MAIQDLSFYAAAAPATILLGLSKGGFTGLSVLAQPILALAISPMQATAIILPVLMIQDVVSLAAYWRRWDNEQLRLLLPGALVGVIAGYLFAASISDAAVEAGIGVLALAEATRQLLKRGSSSRKAQAGRQSGRLWSVLSGFTSMIANAGGPPFMIYLLRQNLPRDAFAATAVAFFAIVNWIKLPSSWLSDRSAAAISPRQSFFSRSRCFQPWLVSVSSRSCPKNAISASFMRFSRQLERSFFMTG
ncbi:sulfite exporter TauE/SafE family protein [Beijerinckia indica]|uniref:Probable membrane transporter protein n=1 Tax=Beijerinckia indica subsp. indica (strain ATCC 9039 / DSM 1715 / NCIMB 8712) TaxID=395963 RepID=B2IKC0_BEII9|nr:sulfite exporter TauE/SafE family protein [Beijerinckia indica]ACB96401.1 protein of unknown function DUF81 [Beijerinckia indica subsp. indica ATCC 9039]